MSISDRRDDFSPTNNDINDMNQTMESSPIDDSINASDTSSVSPVAKPVTKPSTKPPTDVAKVVAKLAKSYSAQRSEKLTIKLRDGLRQLPVFCADYLRSIAANTTPLTQLAYIGDIKIFLIYLITEVPAFANRTADSFTYADMAAVKKRDIDMYLDYLDLYIVNEETEFEGADSYIERTNTWPGKQRKLSTIRSIYSYLYKEERIPANTAELVDMPKSREKPIIRLEPDEMLNLLDEVDSGERLSSRQQKYHEITRLRDMAMLMLMLGTGVRVGECVGINISDLDFSLNAMLITRKGDKEMILYFSDEVARALKEYLAQRSEIETLPGDEDALFLSIQRRRIGIRAVEIMVKKYARLAVPLKKKISPHKLRSTFGTNLYQETGDIYLVADVLGHSDVNTTRRHYADQSDESRRQAARSVKLRET